jgi:hypothetical protein
VAFSCACATPVNVRAAIASARIVRLNMLTPPVLQTRRH